MTQSRQAPSSLPSISAVAASIYSAVVSTSNIAQYNLKMVEPYLNRGKQQEARAEGHRR